MNATLTSNNRSLLLTSTLSIQGTTSRIPQREQVLIDAFNTYIQIGIGSILFLFGLTFNCLSLIYFRASRSFRHTTFQLYFSIIAILDTIRLFEFFIFLLFDKGYLRVTLQLCRWVFFTIMFTGQASIWLTVALAVEKCIIIWFPIKGRLCFTISVSKLVLIIVLCLVFFADVIYLLPRFFLHAYENVSIHTFMCIWQRTDGTSKDKYDHWKKHYFTFNTIFFHSIVPSILLLVINWLILCSLSRQRIILSKIGTIDARHVLKREKQFKEKTIQLVLSSFFVIITISPRYILTMVNAFASNIDKKPLMPLYIYVNLNTIFRVLEMSNYALNLMFAIMSGRTSRREIRKLLWECVLWRCQRTKTSRRGSRIHTHSFLFDDDDDETERSVATTAAAPYPALPIHFQNRSHPGTRQNSHGNYSISASRKASVLNCCGLSIDLSHRHSSYSCNGDTSSRHSTIGKPTTVSNNNINPLNTAASQHHSNSPRKMRTYSQSPMSLPSFDHNLGQQKGISHKSKGDNHRTIARRRTTTAVHCFRQSPSSAITSITSKPLTFNTDSKSISSLSKENDCLTNPILQPMLSYDSQASANTDVVITETKSLKDPNHSPSIAQHYYEEPSSAPCKIETC